MKITSNFTPLWEQWTDPGPDVCGAGTRRAPFTYLAGIDGACVIETEPWESYHLNLEDCYDIAQEACSFVQVEMWKIAEEKFYDDGIICGRCTLTVEEFDESTACEFDEMDEPPEVEDLD